MASVTGTEVMLPYDHNSIRVRQEYGWDCGPASVQIVLQALGVDMDENTLIRELGTDTDGTDTVEQALPILNRMTHGQYRAQWMTVDPAPQADRETFWRNIKASIDAGYGCVLNFEVPANQFPRGTRGSVSPQYRGARVWHYVACMGYAIDPDTSRHVWIADPGFSPFGYWMSANQAAVSIPPHAYAYATAQPAASEPPPAEVGLPPILPPILPPTVPPTVPGQYSSRSVYRTPNEAPMGLDVFAVSDDAMLHTLYTELSAVFLGDPDSIYRIVRAAAGRGADTSPEFVRRARAVLAKVPRDDLAAVVARIEQTDPVLFAALRGS